MTKGADLGSLNMPETEGTHEGSIRVINNTTISFNGDIESENVDEFIQVFSFVANQLRKMIVDYPSYEPYLNIMFTTQGGSVYDAFRMYDSINNFSIPITMYASGLVASSGIIVLLAGHKRYAYKHAQFLYHQISGSVKGTQQQIKGHYHHSKTVSGHIQELIVNNTKLTYDELKEMEKEEHWFDSEEAKEYGIVEDIVTTSFI